MERGALNEVFSSPVKLKIVDAVGVRPRSLGELASLTGITVQGVLRHLNRLSELGLVEERPLSPPTPKARRVYFARSSIVSDCSTPGLTVVKASPVGAPRRQSEGDPERISGELIFQKRRIKEASRKLGRMIEELVSDQEALAASLDNSALDQRERLILEVLLTEETLEDGVKVLSRHYGLDDRRSIEGALAKAKRIVRK